MKILLSVIQIWHMKLKNTLGLTISTWTHICADMIKTKAATPDNCKYIKINDENDFYTSRLPMRK